MRPVGRVNLKEFTERKKPWRAQWRERIATAAGFKSETRSQWFPDKESADKFKAAHEGEAEKFEEIAVTSSDRARWWRLKEDAAKAGASVDDIFAAGLAALKRKVAHTETLETALGLWLLDARDRNLRPKSIEGVKGAVALFLKGRARVPVDAFTGDDLVEWVGTRYPDSQESRDDVLSRLLTFFRWCSAKPRHWCRLDLFTGVKFEHKVKGERKRIGFYTAEEAAAYIAAAPDNYKLALASGFLLGIRPFEMMRVQFEWQHEGEFYGFDAKRGEWHIAPQWAKTRAYRRLYALPDAWWYWYLRYKDTTIPREKRAEKQAGKLVVANYKNFRLTLRRARQRAGLKKSPKDGIRHSFATHGYHRSADGKERGLEWCLDMMGHESGLATFKKRYQGKVSAAEAEAYQLMYPEGAACVVKTRERIVIVPAAEEENRRRALNRAAQCGSLLNLSAARTSGRTDAQHTPR